MTIGSLKRIKAWVMKMGPSQSYRSFILKLVSGTAFAQALPVLIAPILTRLYPPDAFASVALFTSVAVVLTTVSTLRFDMAIVPCKDEQLSRLLQLSMMMAVIVSLVILVVFCCFSQEISAFFQLPKLSGWMLWLPPFILSAAVVQVANSWLNKQKNYSAMAGARIAQAFAVTVVQLLAGITGVWGGLIYGAIIGQAITSCFLLCGIRDCFVGPRIDYAEVKSLFCQYKQYPLFFLPTALLDTLSFQAPVWIIAKYFGSTELALYSMATRVLSLPISLVGNAVGQVFFQNFSEAAPAERKSILLRTWGSLAMLGLLPTLIVMLFGSQLFGLVFGTSWMGAGEMAAIMAPMLFVMFISSPTSSGYIVLNLSRSSLLFGIVCLLVRPIALFAGLRFNNINSGLLLLTILEIVIIMIYNLVLWKKVNAEF